MIIQTEKSLQQNPSSRKSCLAKSCTYPFPSIFDPWGFGGHFFVCLFWSGKPVIAVKSLSWIFKCLIKKTSDPKAPTISNPNVSNTSFCLLSWSVCQTQPTSAIVLVLFSSPSPLSIEDREKNTYFCSFLFTHPGFYLIPSVSCLRSPSHFFPEIHNCNC